MKWYPYEDIVKIVPCPGDIQRFNLADFRLKWVVKFPKWGRKLIANGFPLQNTYLSKKPTKNHEEYEGPAGKTFVNFVVLRDRCAPSTLESIPY
jgi:hypothetical protein